MTVTLATINTAAADLITVAGWTQHTDRDDKGRVCLTGALRHCNPQPGDSYLARELYRRLGHGEEWNDADSRAATEVVTYLRTHPVTDDLLAGTYGPQWEVIVALVRRAAVLTGDEANALDAAWDAAWAEVWNAAGDAAWDAVGDAAWDARETAGDAAKIAVGDAARDLAWNAARDAAHALAFRDLLSVTPDGTNHYLELTHPWAQVIGPVHPDDKD